MKIEGEGQLVRVFIGQADTYNGKPLYSEIVQAARAAGLAGATVLRGVIGYGAHSLVHASKAGVQDQDMPLVIEIVDKHEKLVKFLPMLDVMVKEGLVTVEKVHIQFYRSGR